MLKVFITLSLAVSALAVGPPGCVPCVQGKLPKKAGTAGCVDCTPLPANRADGATLTCELATDGVSIKANSVDITAALPGVNADSGRKCTVGFFYTAKTATSNATCTKCATNCHTCTSATACTKAKAGFFLNNSAPVECVARTAANCGKGKIPIAKTTACAEGNNLTAQLTVANGCTTCAASTIGKGTADGCVACTAVANSANLSTLTCELATATADTVKANSVDITAAPVSTINADSGRKCAVGFFYTAKTATSNATCTACVTTGVNGCHTCTSATACTKAKVGFYLANPPVACVAQTTAQCGKGKVPIAKNTACPDKNTVAAQLTVATGCTACPAGSIQNGAGDGCVACSTVTTANKNKTLLNIAELASLSCELTAPTASTIKETSLDVSAASTGTFKGLKCKPGTYYTAKTATASATCNDCLVGCGRCKNGTKCERAAAGYALVNDVPVNCVLTPLAVCTADGVLKTQNPSANMCPANNRCSEVNSQTVPSGKVCAVHGASGANITGVSVMTLMVALLAIIA